MRNNLVTWAREDWGWKQIAKPDGSREWIKVRPDALTPIGLHEARHSFVTSMALSGVPLKQLSVLAGHEDTAFTLERYGHLYEGHEHEAGALLARFFDPEPDAIEDLDGLSRDDLIALVRDLRASAMPHRMPHEDHGALAMHGAQPNAT